MISFREIEKGFRQLNLNPRTPVIVHASLKSFGDVVPGGANTLLGALTNCFYSVMMPAFTYKTMVIPVVGPKNNGITYGIKNHANLMAEIFDADTTRADSTMGYLAESLRKHPKATRSLHPILSFTGINVQSALEQQTPFQPLAPIQDLSQRQGWVLLVGVNHTVNTSLHLAERLSGRQQFLRWALTPGGVLECPNYPGCSDGFQAIEPYLTSITRRVTIGNALVQAVPILQMLDITLDFLRKVPDGLLCDNVNCERCYAVRQSLAH
jgi:aminoglycoside 3-N-acetyltransferase